MKKRIEEKLLKMISVFLIFLVISSIFTVYLLNPVYAYNYDNEVKTYSYSEEFTTYQQAPSNSASSGNVCCQKTKQNSPFKGENCVYTNTDNCDLNAGQPSGTTCEQTDYCKLMCVF